MNLIIQFLFKNIILNTDCKNIFLIKNRLIKYNFYLLINFNLQKRSIKFYFL